jgi:hypothetical protein
MSHSPGDFHGLFFEIKLASYSGRFESYDSAIHASAF